MNKIKIKNKTKQNTTTNMYRQGCREKGTLIYCWWECKLVQPVWKTIWRLLKNLNIDLPYDPAIPVLGIHPKKCDAGYSRSTCTPMLIVALFTIAKLWIQPRCPTTDEWINKMRCLYTMEFYSAMKKNVYTAMNTHVSKCKNDKIKK
jgi:hypothetical protein